MYGMEWPSRFVQTSDSQPGATWPPRGEFTSLGGGEYRAFGELGRNGPIRGESSNSHLTSFYYYYYYNYF